VRQIRQVRQAIAAGSTGAIDFAVVLAFCCLSACLVRLRVSQLRQVRQVWQAIAAGLAGAIDFAVFGFFCLFLLPFGLPCAAASQSIVAGAAGSEGKSILAAALFAANQSVPLSAAEYQSIAAGAAGTSNLAVTSFAASESFPLCAVANQSNAAHAAGTSIEVVASYMSNQTVWLCAVENQSIRFSVNILSGLRCNSWRRFHFLHFILGRCLIIIVVLFINLPFLGSLKHR
jgi:hypothetical protein